MKVYILMLADGSGGGRPIEVYGSLTSLYRGIFEFFRLNNKQVKLIRIDPKKPNTIIVKWKENDVETLTALWILAKEVIKDE